MNKVNICVLGATGVVGGEMLKVLEERDYPVESLKLLADKNDAGKKIVFKGKKYTVEEATENSFKGVDITLSAVDNPISLIFSPIAVKSGSVVIDNSSAYRMDKKVPLIIPEVNAHSIDAKSTIIANPNCSTIIALVALAPLHKYAKIKRIVASTYQAVSGAGILGIDELINQTKNYLNGKTLENKIFKHQIAFNLIPHIDSFEKNAYTKEEMKLTNETRKILNDASIEISATCVRVPVLRSHSEAITIETEKKLTAKKAKEILSKSNGVKLVDDIDNALYPMPKDTSGQDFVFVGRIREDISCKNSLCLWVCGDQIRKGAATNAVQIAEVVFDKRFK